MPRIPNETAHTWDRLSDDLQHEIAKDLNEAMTNIRRELADKEHQAREDIQHVFLNV